MSAPKTPSGAGGGGAGAGAGSVATITLFGASAARAAWTPSPDAAAMASALPQMESAGSGPLLVVVFIFRCAPLVAAVLGACDDAIDKKKAPVRKTRVDAASFGTAALLGGPSLGRPRSLPGPALDATSAPERRNEASPRQFNRLRKIGDIDLLLFAINLGGVVPHRYAKLEACTGSRQADRRRYRLASVCQSRRTAAAITNSSLVGMTNTSTALSGAEMKEAFCAFVTGSIFTPR